MTRPVAAVALSALLLAPSAMAGKTKLKSPPKMSKAVVYTELTPEQAMALVQPVVDQAEIERPGEGVHDRVWFQVEGLNSVLYLRNEGQGAASTYWIAASFDFELDVPLSMANDWNNSHLFSRAYVDEQGDIVLESDLDLSQGVTQERITDHLLTWRQLLGDFTESIGFYEEGKLAAPEEPQAQEETPEAPSEDAAPATEPSSEE